ncbi:MAG: T4 RnlA family RNA ligase [Bacilli bacterium]
MKKVRVNKSVTNLYNNLMKMCDNRGIQFQYADYVTGMGTKMRVFGYLISSACDWEQKDAKECRGVMFELDQNDKAVRIACRPMEKFFNVGEKNAVGINWDDCEYIGEKLDGSIISTFADCGYLDLKSMSSMHTDVAVKAKIWLNDHYELKQRLRELSIDGYTANCEFVGPSNLNVLSYPEDRLVILNVRNNETGEYVPITEIFNDPILRPYMAAVYPASMGSDEWINDTQEQVGIEGYVVYTANGRTKIKTKWYFEKHAFRDRINSNQQVLQCCFDETSDDLRATVSTNPNALKKIDDLERAYIGRLSAVFSNAVQFLDENKHLDRKSYAEKALIQFGKSDNMSFMVTMWAYADQSYSSILESSKQLVQKYWKELVPEMYVRR